MKKLLLISALVLAGCNNSSGTSSAYKILSYEELVNFRTSCSARDSEQKHLKYILDAKNFDPNPDNLNADDRAYNSRLKATLWWYEYRCSAPQSASSSVSKLDSPKAAYVKSEVVKNGDCQSRISVTLDKDEAEVSANTLTVCGRANPLEEQPKVKIGETVFEMDLAVVNEIQPTYFKHRHSNCRLFRERYMGGNVLQVNHGVICQTDPQMDTWQVLDKW